MISIFSRGDFRFFYPENIVDFASLPSAWDVSLNTGIGKSALGSLWINSYLNFTATFTKLGLSWEAIGLIFWILPSIILSFFSAYYLFKTLFPDSKRFGFLAGFVYLTNTYFLMIFTGGQMGVALAYSIAPLVLARFIKLVDFSSSSSLNFKFLISNYQLLLLAGLILAAQIMFDPRIAYITMIAVVVLAIKKLATLAIPIIIAILLHSYWTLPLVITKSSPLPEGFSDISGFEFFSFADFSHALSLLHPNWPENIFGKTYFLQPEFLILPILAYSSLLFLDLRRKTEDLRRQTIVFFALLGLIGAFLAKGANPPFGEINIWLFQNVPGMFVFRDPTKFYLLTALSYSVLVPFSIDSIQKWLKSKIPTSPRLRGASKIQKYLPNMFLLLAACYLLLLIHPLWAGELGERFKPKPIPQEYVQLKDFLVSQPEFFRTLWIPQWQRYGFFSNNHPAIGRFEVLKQASASGQIEELQKDSTKNLLQDLAVKYIIVPYDSEGEIFLDDRKYSEEKRQEVEEELDKISWLTKIRLNDSNHFNKIAVYEVPDVRDRFWSPSDLEISYSFIYPTEYKAELKNAREGDLLVLSENFDKNWQAESSEFRVQSSEFRDRLNSFVLQKDGDYVLTIYYQPQRWVNIGLAISGTTILAVLGLMGLKKMKNK